MAKERVNSKGITIIINLTLIQRVDKFAKARGFKRSAAMRLLIEKGFEVINELTTKHTPVSYTHLTLPTKRIV